MKYTTIVAVPALFAPVVVPERFVPVKITFTAPVYEVPSDFFRVAVIVKEKLTEGALSVVSRVMLLGPESGDVIVRLVPQGYVVNPVPAAERV